MNDNTEVVKIAEKVISKIPNNNSHNFGFVITILMVISIILTLIRILQECDKSKVGSFSQSEKYSFYGEQIKEKTIKRSWFTKMMIKKAIRKELSRDNYKTYGYDLMNAILDTGEHLSKEETITLLEAANV